MGLGESYLKKKKLAVQHVFISSTKRSDHSNTRLAIQIEKDAGMAWEFGCLLDLQNVMYLHHRGFAWEAEEMQRV